MAWPDPIQDPDHLQTELFKTIQNLMSRFQSRTVVGNLATGATLQQVITQHDKYDDDSTNRQKQI